VLVGVLTQRSWYLVSVKLTMRELRILLMEEIEPDCWGGSHPTETYSELLEDDPAHQKQSVLVPDDIKHSISAWMKKMGLSNQKLRIST
jgi:hypothetical protein